MSRAQTPRTRVVRRPSPLPAVMSYLHAAAFKHTRTAESGASSRQQRRVTSTVIDAVTDIVTDTVSQAAPADLGTHMN